MDIDHGAQASQIIPCHRESLCNRDGLWFRKNIPILRLLEGSKGGEVVKFVDIFQRTSPKWAYKSRGGNLLPPILNLQGNYLLAQRHMTLRFL